MVLGIMISIRTPLWILPFLESHIGFHCIVLDQHICYCCVSHPISRIDCTRRGCLNRLTHQPVLTYFRFLAWSLAQWETLCSDTVYLADTQLFQWSSHICPIRNDPKFKQQRIQHYRDPKDPSKWSSRSFLGKIHYPSFGFIAVPAIWQN